jgi:hypothetical protein
MSICILADAADIDCAKQIKLEYMSVDDPKKYVCNLIWICSMILSLEIQVKQEKEACQSSRTTTLSKILSVSLEQ